MKMASTISAAGTSLPPFFIFPKKNHTENKIFQEDPEHSEAQSQCNEWINNDYFIDYLQHFVANTGCSIKKPHLLILVQPVNFKLSKVKKYTDDWGIILLTIPSKHSHILQPFDVYLSTAFKNMINKSARVWVDSNPHRSMEVYDIPDLVSAINSTVFTKKGIQVGFQATGIHPFNNSIIHSISPIKTDELHNIERNSDLVNNDKNSHNESNAEEMCSDTQYKNDPDAEKKIIIKEIIQSILSKQKQIIFKKNF